MILHPVTPRCLLFIFLLGACIGQARAHGGVVEEDDLCVIKVNYLSAHFKIYQPLVSGHEQFCEDIPVASESIFVMEYQHDSLAAMPIDFRIIRDVTGKGRFARMEDIEQIDDIKTATVFYQEPIIEPDVYTVLYDFEEEGDFVGIVSARHPETGKLYAAVFPFEVGFTGIGYWPYIIGLLVLIQLQFLYMSGRLNRWFGKSGVAAPLLPLLLLLVASDLQAADLVLHYSTPGGKIEINKMHSWILHVENEQGTPVEGAVIEVEGGMPAHDHGLPTRPRVTEELGGGDYKLEGMRFHMSGQWEIVVTITTDTGQITKTIALDL